MVPLFVSGTGRKAVVHLGSLDSSPTGLLHRDVRTEFVSIWFWNSRAVFFGKFRNSLFEGTAILVCGDSQDRCFWNWRRADGGIVDVLFGNVWDATHLQRGGSEIPACLIAVPDYVF